MINLNKNSRNGEAYAVADRIIATYQQSNLITNNTLAALMEQMIALKDTFSSAINRMKEASELEDKDLVRDNTFKSLYFLVQGATFHPEDELNVAAQRIFTYLEHYGLDITRENYDSETSLLDSLITDISTNELQNAASKITGCAQLLEKLKLAQHDFKETRRKYQSSQSDSEKKSNATELKKQMIDFINTKLLVYLAGMMVVEEQAYAPLVTNINTTISEHNKIVRMRSVS